MGGWGFSLIHSRPLFKGRLARRGERPKICCEHESTNPTRSRPSLSIFTSVSSLFRGPAPKASTPVLTVVLPLPPPTFSNDSTIVYFV